MCYGKNPSFKYGPGSEFSFFLNSFYKNDDKSRTWFNGKH